MWELFLILAVICFTVGVISMRRPRRDGGAVPREDLALVSRQEHTNMPTPLDASAPTVWDEVAITAQLQQLRQHQPTLIPYFIESVKERLILRQDDRTAQTRLQFMRTQLEQLKLGKDIQAAIDDLFLLALEREKRVKTLEFENQEIESRKRALSWEEERSRRLREKQLEYEIAELDHKIAGLKPKMATDAPISPEQQRAKDRVVCEAKIEGLKEEKRRAQTLPDEDERHHRVNAIDQAIAREYERWSKLL